MSIKPGQPQITAIDTYLATHNDAPKPFIWTKRADDILAKVRRARAVLDERAVTHV